MEKVRASLIREARKRTGMSLREASKKSGLSHQYLSMLENGGIRSIRKQNNVDKIAKIYGLNASISAFLSGSTQPDNIRASSSLYRRFSDWSRYANDTRDIETSLGYPVALAYQDYLHKYRRQDIAHRIVKAPVDAVWVVPPNIYESQEEDTSFEEALDILFERVRMYYFMYKLDLMASLGRYACLFLGLSDAGDLSVKPEGSFDLSYVTALPEPNVQIITYDNNPSSERFGMPEEYRVQISLDDMNSLTKRIHWSRLIHVAENTLESETYGIPALEPVYNRLIGLEKIVGASPEIYWLGARGGFAAISNSDSSVLTDEDREAMETQLSDFTNNLKRWLFAEGIDIKSMAPQVASPKDHVEAQMQLISSVTRIPMRILTGSERGELASTQDERQWNNYIEERREGVATKLILRPLIDRLIDFDILPLPKEGYHIEWDALTAISEKEHAEIDRLRTDALVSYADSPVASMIIPPEVFLQKYQNISEAETELILGINDAAVKEEDEERPERNMERNESNAG